jgi:hypothetical protein
MSNETPDKTFRQGLAIFFLVSCFSPVILGAVGYISGNIFHFLLGQFIADHVKSGPLVDLGIPLIFSLFGAFLVYIYLILMAAASVRKTIEK